MATHSSTSAWRIPRIEEPGGLQSMGSQRVGHDGATDQQQRSLFRRFPLVILSPSKKIKYHIYTD